MFSKKLSANTFLVIMLLVGLVGFVACSDTGTRDEPAGVVEEPGLVEDENLVEDEGLVEEEPLAEEEQGTLGEEPLAEEEGLQEGVTGEDESLVEEGTLEEEQGTLGEEPLAEEEGLQEGVTGEDESLVEEGTLEEEPLAEEGMVEEGVAGEEQAMGMEDQFPIRVSELTGNDIMTQANENLGQVEDVVIGLNNNVDYAIVSFGDQGILDLGDEGAMMAVPLTALQPAGEEGTFYFMGEATVLQTAPRFTEDQWGNLADATWDDDIFNFWQQEQELALLPETGSQEAAAEDTPAFVRTSELMDQNIVNTAGEDIGNIEDIVLQPQPNQADYTIVSISEGLFDIGADERVAVPLNQINIAAATDTDDTTFTLDSDSMMLEQAPRFTDDTIDLTNPAWDDEFNNYWGIQDETAGAGGS